MIGRVYATMGGKLCGVLLRVVGEDLNVCRAVLVELLFLQTLAFSLLVVQKPAALLGVHSINCTRNENSQGGDAWSSSVPAQWLAL